MKNGTLPRRVRLNIHIYFSKNTAAERAQVIIFYSSRKGSAIISYVQYGYGTRTVRTVV